MNTNIVRNRVAAALSIVAVAAILMLGNSISRFRISERRQTTLSFHHSIQLADGSESNGGKGGGKGSHRTEIA